jgi:hypothetical protein
MAATTRPTTRVAALAVLPRPGSAPVELEVLAREAGLHPEVVRRLVALGVIDQPVDGRFPRDAAARLARVSRLRRDLALSYAGAALACDLLARIDALEARLRRYEPTSNRQR